MGQARHTLRSISDPVYPLGGKRQTTRQRDGQTQMTNMLGEFKYLFHEIPANLTNKRHTIVLMLCVT